MKHLTGQEYEDAPTIIKFIIQCKSMNIPILYDYFESAIKEYPEYFPDEVKYREELVGKPGMLDNDYNLPITTKQINIVNPLCELRRAKNTIIAYYEYRDWIEKRLGKYEKKSR